MFEFSQEQIDKVLGKGEYQPKNKMVCFLPFLGEFGWYIMTYVKRVQGYNHANKIVCAKLGHECLFPSVNEFYYDWQDIADDQKAGIISNTSEAELKTKICQHFGTDDIYFLSPSDVSWDEKLSLANNVFIPKSRHNLGLVADIVITPRNRKIDAHRNWTAKNWQHVIDNLKDHNITVAVCGTPDTSFALHNVLYKSYDYIDVDSDVELMNNAKLVVSQESGLAYLSYLCRRPTFIIDHYHKDFGADLHRDLSVPFREVKYVWSDPDALVNEIILFLKGKE